MSRAGSYALVFAVVVGTTLLTTPLVRRLAVRGGAVVKPDERRVHERPTPTLGGIAMALGFLAGMVVAWRLDAFRDMFAGSTEALGVVVAALITVAVGVIDDLREVSAPAKVAGIVLAASALVLSGVSIFVLRIPFTGLLQLSSDWSYLISVVWVLAVANAINLIDGLDGLAAGIVAIAAATFFAYTLRLGDAGLLAPSNIGPLVALVVLGMCVGFLPFNVHPARIFMGDGGALVLGVLMAASTMVVGGRTDQPFSGNVFFFYAPMLIPLVILGVPLVDTALAIVRRAARRSGVATADKDHLHHRLMRMGHGHRRSVLLLWAWTALLSGFVLYPTYTGQGNGIVPLVILGALLLLFTILHPGVSRRRTGEPGEPGEDADQLVETAAGPAPAVGLTAADAATAVPVDGRQLRRRASRERARRRAQAGQPGTGPTGGRNDRRRRS
ncbi:MAG: MraY family glycosyltransferase [Acidimicrobiales bacterium]